MLAAALCLAAALLGTPPANALSQRGHEFGESFGAGAKLSGPSGLAVNEATGHVYVLDSANNRVAVFGPGPQHEFLEAWGAGVKSGGKTYQTCKAAECKAGTAGFGKGAFDAPAAIAVDNSNTSPSHGDVYVVANHTAKKAVLDKFSASGEYMERVLGGHEEKEEFEENPIVGVAVGPTGTVWVEREAEEGEFWIQRLGNGIKNAPLGVPSDISPEPFEGVVRPGLAVDGKGGLYVRYEPAGHTLVEQEEEEEEIKEEEKERKEEEKELKEVLPPLNLKPQLPCEKHPCIVAKFAIVESGEAVKVTPVVNPLDGFDSAGLAVDESSGAPSSGDSYVAHKANVAAFTVGGRPIQTFGAGKLGEAGGVAVDAETDEVLVSDAKGGVLDTFTPAHAAPPEIATGSPVAAHVTSSSAELRATIDPTGSRSRYRFEYGTASCSEPGSECLTAPAQGAAAGELGQGFGNQTAAQLVVGLSPGVTYHLRVLVEYSFEEGGSTKSGTVASEEKTFTTPSSSLEAALPDGRRWEKVSPTQKNGASIEASAREGGVLEASLSGNAFTYTATGPFGENEPEGYRGPEPSQILATRTPTGWTARDIATPNLEAEGARPGLPREYDFFSSELQGTLLGQLPGKPILSGETSESSIYLRNNLTCAEAPTGCFEPIVSPKDDLAGSKYRGALDVLGASPDLQHVVLRSGVPLLEKAPQEGMYEWSSQSGQLTLLSVLPKEEGPAPGGGFLGAEGPNPESQEGLMTAAAISHDGSRIEWYPRGSKHLFTRDVQTAETLQVDELEEGLTKPEAELPATFQNASADGSKIFFTDATALTKSSTAPGEAAAPDLYVFEPAQPEGHRVTDLSVPIQKGEAAAVQGAVTGVSEDGRTVYFVADGELREGVERGSCGEPGGTGCNLYVEHDGEGGWEQPRLVARLSSKDNPDWGEPNGNETYHLEFKTSEVSPNGQYLAFMSEESLTGYNNTDASSGEPDEEVFLYHNEGGSGQLICASCNPSGEQPTGVFDQLNSGEGQGLLVDRPRVWGGTLTENVDRWLAGSVPGWTAFALYDTAYQPRYLTDQGRLFFNSSDSLVRRDVNNGKEDVYQFEPEGIGGCQTANTAGGCIALISSGESERESAFLDASESGNDVFFLTSAKLSSTDTDNAYDVYDARVCEAEGAEPCIEPPAPAPEECRGEACRAPYVPSSGFATPSSSTLSGSGNLLEKIGVLSEKQQKPPPTNAQRLASALKACHKDKQKKKRQACERQARKRYPAKKASSAKASRIGHKPGFQAARRMTSNHAGGSR